MASKQRKVERHRQKRRRKQHQRQRFVMQHQQRITTDAFQLHACYANRHWKDDGCASIFMARSLDEGSVTMAAFYVDLWAMGLKDAWGRTAIPVSEFQETMEKADERVELAPLDIETAKHLVYGGIEQARELGFRLPRKYQRWTRILGPLCDGETPDMGLFLDDGVIRLVCNLRDLEGRLIGSTVDEFLARDDVEVVLGPDDFTLLDDEDTDGEEFVEALGDAMYEQVKQWCFANGQRPHRLLPQVIDASLVATAQGVPPDVDPNDERAYDSLSEEQRNRLSGEVFAFIAASLDKDDPGAIEAVEQFMRFVRSTGSVDALMERMDPKKG